MARKNIPKSLRSARTARVLFGDVIYEPGGSCGPRVQADYQMVVLVEGGVRATVEGRALTLAAGQVGLFLPGRLEWFSFVTDRKSHHTWCSLHPSLVSEELAARALAAPAVLPVSRRFGQLMELGLSLPRRAEGSAPGLV